MAGRRPKPNEIKQIEGNPGGRPLNLDCPKAPTGAPEMPKGMRKAAQREWKRITRDLLELGVLTIVDGKGLMGYCDAYADWEEAQRECVAEGLWIEEPIVNKEGNVVGYKKKAAPWFTIKYAALKTMKSFLIEYGLTPASRTKLKIEKKPDGPTFPTREESARTNDEPNLEDIDTSVVM